MTALLMVSMIMICVIALLLLFTALAVLLLVLQPSPGGHSAPTPVRQRVLPRRESMQLEEDEAWDAIRASLETERDDWPAALPLHARRQPAPDYELPRAA